MTIYQIAAWDDNFENSRSREIEHPAFVIMPNKQHGMGFQRILGQSDGVAMFGLWTLILQACSRQRSNAEQVREGWLTDDGTAHGVPWDADDIALRWHLSVEFAQRALDLFTHPKVGWMKKLDAPPALICRAAADALPTECQPTAIRPCESPQHAADRTEQNRTEQKKKTASSPPPSPARATTTAAKSRRVIGIDAARARRALEDGDLAELVQAHGGNVADDRAGEWARDCHGVTLHTIAVILGWQVYQRTPIREPSGWRKAWAAWQAETKEKRVTISSDVLDKIGVSIEVRPAQPVSVPA